MLTLTLIEECKVKKLTLVKSFEDYFMCDLNL